MKTFKFIFLFIFIILITYTKSDAQLINPAVIEAAPQSYGLIRQVKYQSEVLENYYFWANTWNNGKIYFLNQKILENVSIKYDIKNNDIYILFKDTVKILNGKMIQKFQWINQETQKTENFINSSNLSSSSSLFGFLQLLCEGNLSLYLQTTVGVQQANYVPALGVGNRDDKYITEQHLFFLKNKKIIRLSKRKQENLEVFKDKIINIEQYIKENHLNIRKNEDLIKLINYYNSK